MDRRYREPQHVVVSSQGQLSRLARGPVSLLGKGTLLLQVPGVPDDARAYWQRRLGKLYFSCGCLEGTVLTLTFLAAWVAHTAWSWSTATPWLWQEMAWGLAGLVSFSLVGKAGGIAVARLRLLWAVRDLLRKMDMADAVRAATTTSTVV